MATGRRTSRRLGARVGVLVLAVALLGPVSVARADDHDPQESGHPLRIIAYIVHPVGVIVDTLIFRPAHWLVHKGPLPTLFGHDHYEE